MRVRAVRKFWRSWAGWVSWGCPCGEMVGRNTVEFDQFFVEAPDAAAVFRGGLDVGEEKDMIGFYVLLVHLSG